MLIFRVKIEQAPCKNSVDCLRLSPGNFSKIFAELQSSGARSVHLPRLRELSYGFSYFFGLREDASPASTQIGYVPDCPAATDLTSDRMAQLAAVCRPYPLLRKAEPSPSPPSSSLPVPSLPSLTARQWWQKIQYTSRFVRVILAQGPC